MLENEAFRTMFYKYADMIHRIGISYCDSSDLAEDVVQEVFLRYLNKAPAFENEVHEKAWFIRVTVNCCKSQLTNAWRRRTVPLVQVGQASSFHFEDPRQELLFEQVRQLPQKYRLVLYLRYYEDYSVNDIASLLHLTPNTVSARLSRARKKLKEQYDAVAELQ